MAFPSVRSSTVTSISTATTSPVVNLPATVSAGDTLVVYYRLAITGVITWPSADWHELFDVANDGDQSACAWKKADGTEGGTTITLTTGNGKGASVSYSIQGAADPTVTAPEVGGSLANGTASNIANPGNCTPTGGAKDYLWLAMGGFEGEQTFQGYPTNYTLGQQNTNSGTGGSAASNCLAFGAARQLNASSEDASFFTVSDAGDWMAACLAIHPVAGTVVTSDVTSNAAVNRTEVEEVTTDAKVSRIEVEEVMSDASMGLIVNSDVTSDAVVIILGEEDVTSDAALSALVVANVTSDASITVVGGPSSGFFAFFG